MPGEVRGDPEDELVLDEATTPNTRRAPVPCIMQYQFYHPDPSQYFALQILIYTFSARIQDYLDLHTFCTLTKYGIAC